MSISRKLVQMYLLIGIKREVALLGRGRERGGE
jgi:hypothetical protein